MKMLRLKSACECYLAEGIPAVHTAAEDSLAAGSLAVDSLADSLAEGTLADSLVEGTLPGQDILAGHSLAGRMPAAGRTAVSLPENRNSLPWMQAAPRAMRSKY